MAEPTISIAYEEMEDSPTEQFNGPQGFQATRLLRCAWADRLTLADELQGSFLSGGSYVTNLPHLYPHRAGVRCTSVPNIVGHDADRPQAYGGDTKVAAYAYALLTVNYTVAGQPPTGGGGSVELVDETITPFSEFTTISPKDLTWGGIGGTPLTNDEAIGKLFRGFNWQYTRLNVASVAPEYATLIGCVNNAAITSTRLGFTFPAETLLFQPPILTRRVNADGVSSKWTIQTNLSFKPQGWNVWFRASTGAYGAIFNAAGQVKPYTPADFSPIIS
jgi:hypothetical protein